MNKKDRYDDFEEFINFMIDEEDPLLPDTSEIYDSMENWEFYGEEFDDPDLIHPDFDDELDEDLLFAVLDHLGGTSCYSEIQEQEEVQEPTVVFKQLIRRHSTGEIWIHADEDNSRRPVLCMNCLTDNCQHIDETSLDTGRNIIDLAREHCDHDEKSEIIGTCINCIRYISKKLQEKKIHPGIVFLWDTIDIAKYYLQKIESDIEYGVLN